MDRTSMLKLLDVMQTQLDLLREVNETLIQLSDELNEIKERVEDLTLQVTPPTMNK